MTDINNKETIQIKSKFFRKGGNWCSVLDLGTASLSPTCVLGIVYVFRSDHLHGPPGLAPTVPSPPCSGGPRAGCRAPGGDS